jgi:hypothetical protein
VQGARVRYGVSERRACRLLQQWRGTQRYAPQRRVDEDQLTAAIIALAGQYGRYGYRRITALLNQAGFAVGKDRVQRIWRCAGLKYLNSRSRGADCGSTMAPVSGCARYVPITSGAMISWPLRPTMAGA